MDLGRRGRDSSDSRFRNRTPVRPPSATDGFRRCCRSPEDDWPLRGSGVMSAQRRRPSRFSPARESIRNLEAVCSRPGAGSRLPCRGCWVRLRSRRDWRCSPLDHSQGRVWCSASCRCHCNSSTGPGRCHCSRSTSAPRHRIRWSFHDRCNSCTASDPGQSSHCSGSSRSLGTTGNWNPCRAPEESFPDSRSEPKRREARAPASRRGDGVSWHPDGNDPELVL